MRQRARRSLVLVAAVALLGGGCSADVPTSSTGPSSTTTSTAPGTTGTVPESTTSTTAPPATAAEEVAVFVTDLIEQDRFSGVVLVASGEEVLFQAAGGTADREAGVVNAVDTRFNLGSMNKMFTAVAILQLLEQQALRLDGTIADYLPDYPDPEVAAQVTVEQLLTHTSGLGDVFTAEFEADPHRFRTNADYLPLFAGKPLEFPPGGQFSYSNAGYVVLGLIIERLSGLSYDDYLRRHVFAPAGMGSTDLFDVDEDVPDLAVGYTTVDMQGNETGVLQAHTALMPGRGFAAGGGYATAADLLRFHDALFGHVLLGSDSLDLLLTGRVEVREHIRYAFGFFDRDQAGHRVVGHTGGAPGVCSFMDMYPETGHTVVVLSNSDGDCAAVLEYLADHPLL